MSGTQVTRRAGASRLDELLLMAAVARRHYWERRTRVEIADELGISRFKVSRLLESAVATGLVRIEINVPESVDADLSLRVKEKFGLDRALVATAPSARPEAVRDALGRATAALLADIVHPEDVLGVTSGRTINATARHLTSLAGCEIIQLTGMSGDLNDNPVEVLRRVAEISGGHARSIFAPLTVATAEAAAALKTDPVIAAAFRRFPSVTIVVAAVGSWQPPDSRYFDGIPIAERNALLAQDVMADVGGALLNSKGAPVHDFDDRVLGVSIEELKHAEQVIVVGGGFPKVGAIRATLRAGFVTTLITDDSVARSLLTED